MVATGSSAPSKCHKTKLCKFYTMGICVKGGACTFAHGLAELSDLSSTSQGSQAALPRLLGGRILGQPVVAGLVSKPEAAAADAKELGGLRADRRRHTMPSPLPAFNPGVPLSPGNSEDGIGQRRVTDPNISLAAELGVASGPAPGGEVAGRAPEGARQTAPQLDGVAIAAARAALQSMTITKNKFHKTKMCSYFLAGRCKKHGHCNFAHGGEELTIVPDPRCKSSNAKEDSKDTKSRRARKSAGLVPQQPGAEFQTDSDSEDGPGVSRVRTEPRFSAAGLARRQNAFHAMQLAEMLRPQQQATNCSDYTLDTDSDEAGKPMTHVRTEPIWQREKIPRTESDVTMDAEPEMEPGRPKTPTVSPSRAEGECCWMTDSEDEACMRVGRVRTDPDFSVPRHGAAKPFVGGDVGLSTRQDESSVNHVRTEPSRSSTRLLRFQQEFLEMETEESEKSRTGPPVMQQFANSKVDDDSDSEDYSEPSMTCVRTEPSRSATRLLRFQLEFLGVEPEKPERVSASAPKTQFADSDAGCNSDSEDSSNQPLITRVRTDPGFHVQDNVCGKASSARPYTVAGAEADGEEEDSDTEDPGLASANFLRVKNTFLTVETDEERALVPRRPHSAPPRVACPAANAEGLPQRARRAPRSRQRPAPPPPPALPEPSTARPSTPPPRARVGLRAAAAAGLPRLAAPGLAAPRGAALRGAEPPRRSNPSTTVTPQPARNVRVGLKELLDGAGPRCQPQRQAQRQPPQAAAGPAAARAPRREAPQQPPAPLQQVPRAWAPLQAVALHPVAQPAAPVSWVVMHGA